MTYSVLDLGKEQYYQGKMAVKPPNFFKKAMAPCDYFLKHKMSEILKTLLLNSNFYIN